MDAAWKEAKAGGYSANLWRQIAEKREKDHPEDAVGLLRMVHGLMVGMWKKREFKKFLAGVREGNRL